MTDEDMVDRACNFYIIHASEIIQGHEQFLDIYSQKFVLTDVNFLEEIENLVHENLNEGHELVDFNADDFRRQVILFSHTLKNRGKNHTHIPHLRLAVSKKISQDLKRNVSPACDVSRPYNEPKN
jgi:hypothetical protein